MLLLCGPLLPLEPDPSLLLLLLLLLLVWQHRHT
jgi:hypothetical protein